jgi:dihydrolipoamide dehydrogenase
MVMGSLRREADLVVIGAGPGGYVAALRAADLGRDVLLVEERERPGGVCLLEGCIPSKALINAVEVARDIREMGRFGINVPGAPTFDPATLRAWAASVVDGLAKGVESLLASRGVEVVRGRARFTGPRSLAISGSDVSGIDFRNAIVATGSRPVMLPGAGDLGLWTSTEAVAVPEIPKRLVVIGGGYIGLELGFVYAGLGSAVTLVERSGAIASTPDPDLSRTVAKNANERFERILLETMVAGVERTGDGYRLAVERKGDRSTIEADRVLVAIGRRPNTDDLGLETTAVKLDGRGFVEVDASRRTADAGIFAIGDVTTGPMLAHKASREAKVAAEALAGQPVAFDNRSIPAVVFTDPELAWTGLTEAEAKAGGRAVKVGRFPLTALGRARTMGRTDGVVKVVSDAGTGLVLGVAIAAPHASELIAEGSLAIEMGATIEDMLVTIHPHPTLSEANMEAAEAAAGVGVHLARARKP